MAGFMVYGGGLYCFVLFVPPLTQEFHWNRAATSGLVTAFWLSAPLILLGGAAIRRFGATRLLIAGIVSEAACVMMLSTVSTLSEMYALRVAMGLGKVMFAVTLPYAVSRWFTHNYAFALGIAWAGWHVGGLVLAPIAGWIIRDFGWRVACLAIGGGLLTIGLIPILATLRGAAPPPAAFPKEQVRKGNREAPIGSLRDLFGSAVFWLVVLTTVFYYATYGALLSHQDAVVEAAGFSPRLSSLVLGSAAGFAALGSMSSGWVVDRYSVRSVGMAMQLLLLVGAVSLLWVGRESSAPALAAYAVCFGIAIGGGDVYFVALLRQMFPTTSVAYIYSAWYFCQILTLSLSGPAAGAVFDLTGNYNRTLSLIALSAVLSLIFSLIIVRRGPVSFVK
jgi:MFS family permease